MERRAFRPKQIRFDFFKKESMLFQHIQLLYAAIGINYNPQPQPLLNCIASSCYVDS